MSGMTDYLENKLIDWLVRGQSFTPPATLYAALFTATPSDAGGGTEVSGGSYARVAITSDMTHWAGTQAAASTTTSSGTNGTTSNNGTVTFPAPTGNWGTTVAIGLFDASTSGNMLFWAPLVTNKTVNSSDAAPVFPAAQILIQIDN